MFNARLTVAVAAMMLAAPSISAADDWTASKLRGQVVQLVDNQWVPLQRGDVVPDTRYVATLATGHVELTRGGETITLEPGSQIRIYDKGGAKPFTTVKQDFGTVSVEAQVEQVQHFSVQTQYLAAVVKGTRFTVTSGKTGASVSVRRGHVEVDDQHNNTHTTLSVGQTAVVDTFSTAGAIEVAGDGKLPPVLDKKGALVAPPDPKAVAKSADKAAAVALQNASDLKAVAKKAEDDAKLLKTPETKAAADAAKKAADQAQKAADAASKRDKDADMAEKDTEKPTPNSGPGGTGGVADPGGGGGPGGGGPGGGGPGGGGPGGGGPGGGGRPGGDGDKPDKSDKPGKDK